MLRPQNSARGLPVVRLVMCGARFQFEQEILVLVVATLISSPAKARVSDSQKLTIKNVQCRPRCDAAHKRPCCLESSGDP
jgi:hypothetical protein